MKEKHILVVNADTNVAYGKAKTTCNETASSKTKADVKIHFLNEAAGVDKWLYISIKSTRGGAPSIANSTRRDAAMYNKGGGVSNAATFRKHLGAFDELVSLFPVSKTA